MKCRLLACSGDDGMNQAIVASCGNVDISMYTVVHETVLDDGMLMSAIVEHIMQFLWSESAHGIGLHGPQIGDIIIAGNRVFMLYSNVGDSLFDMYYVVPAWPDWIFADITLPLGPETAHVWRAEDGPLRRQDVN